MHRWLAFNIEDSGIMEQKKHDNVRKQASNLYHRRPYHHRYRRRLPRHDHNYNNIKNNNNYNNEEDAFTIVQFADLHFGDNETQNEKSNGVMQTVLQSEPSIDLVVFSGDQISGWLIDDPIKTMQLLESALQTVRSAGIEYAVLWGNHDDQPYHFDTGVWFTWANRISCLLAVITTFIFFLFNNNNNNKTKEKNYRYSKTIIISVLLILQATAAYIMFLTMPSKKTRHVMQAFESAHELSISQSAHEQVHGNSNFYYRMRILNHSILLLFFDSGGGRLPEQIYDDQVIWAEEIFANFPGSISLAFMHIPLPEYSAAFADVFAVENNNNNNGSSSWRCFGEHGETPSSVNYEHRSLYECLSEGEGGTKAIFVGHDHANSWCCVPSLSSEHHNHHSHLFTKKPYQKNMPALCYGRHTGYGGYAAATTTDNEDGAPQIKKRGARVIKISASSQAPAAGVHITTWLRMEDKTLQDYGVLL